MDALAGREALVAVLIALMVAIGLAVGAIAVWIV